MGQREDAIAALPPGVARAWGLDRRPRKGPKPGLSLDGILTAAIELADEDGLAALSMSRIAARLGFTTMSLYRYVSSKDELLTLLLDAATPASSLQHMGEGWRPALTEWAESQIRLLLVHPWVLELSMPNPPMGPNSLTWVEQALQALKETGLEPWEQMGVIGVLSSYGLSEARLARDGAQQEQSFGEQLRVLVDPVRFPALHAVVDSGQLDVLPERGGPDEYTRFGLERILDGVEALITARAKEARRARRRAT